MGRLPHYPSLKTVGLLLHMSEILCLFPFVFEAILKTMQYQVTFSRRIIRKENRLWNISHIRQRLVGIETARNLDNRFLSHAVYYHVGGGISQNRGS